MDRQPDTWGEYVVEPDGGTVGAQWEELADRVRGVPFLHPGWIRAWSRAFGGGRPELHALRRDGELAAVVPLEASAIGRSSPTNYETPAFGILAADRDTARELAVYLLRRGDARVSLGFLEGGERDLDDLRAAARIAGRRVVERTLQRSPYVPIGSDPEAEVRSRLGAKGFSELRRRRKRLAELGPVLLEVVDGTQALDRFLGEGYALEGSGWKTASGTSIAARPDARRFYDDVSRWAAERGILRLCFLRVGGRAVAFKLALEADGALYSCKGGYDPAASQFAPGKLIVLELLLWASARGLQRLELLGDAYPWKLEWTDHLRPRVLFEAFRSSPVGLAAWAAERHGRPLAKRLGVKRLVARVRKGG